MSSVPDETGAGSVLPQTLMGQSLARDTSGHICDQEKKNHF